MYICRGIIHHKTILKSYSWNQWSPGHQIENETNLGTRHLTYQNGKKKKMNSVVFLNAMRMLELIVNPIHFTSTKYWPPYNKLKIIPLVQEIYFTKAWIIVIGLDEGPNLHDLCSCLHIFLMNLLQINILFKIGLWSIFIII